MAGETGGRRKTSKNQKAGTGSRQTKPKQGGMGVTSKEAPHRYTSAGEKVEEREGPGLLITVPGPDETQTTN